MDRVSIGVREQGAMHVVAVSHGVAVEAQQDLTRALAAAMDEAADQAATITLPDAAGFPRVTLAHGELRRIGGAASGAVCTLPIVHEGAVAGAITLERHEGLAFAADDVAQWEHVANLVGPLLLLKAQSEATWFERLRAACARQWARLKAPGETPFKLALGASALAASFALLVPLPHSVSAPARLEGEVQRALVAAFDGYIQQTAVRPGDLVKAGQVLAELAQQDLQLERSKRDSEFSQQASAYSAAFARADRAQLMVSQAKMAEARAQLELVDQQIARTQIKAPFDGVVISGDLTQKLGTPVQRGTLLMTVAPAQRFRLIVEIDERDIRDIKPGAAGRVALAAMPEVPLTFRVERVTPLSATREGRHFFEVEGKLDGVNTSLRPGLQGVARIEAPSQPLASMVLGRLGNWLRLHLWSWGWLR
jgi:RND family efflux transporter MFP subunit